LEAEHVEKGLLEPTIDEKVARKPGSGRLKVLIDSDCQQIFNAYTKDKASRKKRQHHIALKEGFEVCRRTIEARMRKMNLNRVKPTKKLALTPIQRAQRYEIALSH
jgi:hypothetical protein